MKTKLTIRRWLSVALCGTAVALGTGWAAAQYQSSGPQSQAASALGDVTTVRGKVAKETTNPPGDVDGWVLEDGKTVNFPPHAYQSLREWIKTGDEIVVQTTPRTDPRGRQLQVAVTIQKGDRTVTIEPPKRHEPNFEREEPMKLSGNVTGFHENPHGDVDGIFLDDDTEVKFPPHMGRKIQGAVSVGDTITAEGKRHVTPKGDLHLRADVITAKSETIEIDHPKGPKPPPHDHGPQEDWMTKKQADEMISELRAIRKLLENRN